MRAWVHERSSKQPVLRDLPEPKPGPGEVLVEVEAVSLHPVDAETAAGGNAMLLPLSRPFVGGVDLVGRVAGPGDLPVGTRVYAYRGVPTQGAWAERVAVPRAHLAPAPELDLATLACMPLPVLCALQALDAHPVPEGARVLVLGGYGGVGSAAVQVFAGRGLRVVATARGANAEAVRGLGAEEGIDPGRERLEDRVRDVDLVFDTVGGEALQRAFGVVRRGGAVVSLSALPPLDAMVEAGMSVPLPLRWVLPAAAWWAGRAARSAGVAFAGQVTVPSGSRLAEATALAARRGFRARVGATLPWDRLADGLALVASGKAGGRVVVTRS